MSRLEKLKLMHQEDPTDQFVRYGLAMEYRSHSEFEESLELFNGLIADSPPHVPSFFMMGQMFVEMDRVDDARAILQKGIEEGKSQGDLHAAGEMKEFLATLES